jgi:thiamine biosynthesis lipoprotein
LHAVETYRRSTLAMDTLISLTVRADAPEADVASRMERAFGWFDTVERICTRFDPDSEVMRLTKRIGVPVAVSPTLFAVVEFALAVAGASEGAFDPTVGARLERRGFNRNYRTGRTVDSTIASTERVTWRDVELDAARQTVTLHMPLVLDLGAVAKGFAIDLAARELDVFAHYAVEAGGDLALKGQNAEGEPWQVGIRHPRADGERIAHLAVTDAAICTSGDYERRGTADDRDHHLIVPESGASPTAVASVTVVAPTAMAADALSTAAFVLGPVRGRDFLDQQGVDGMLISPTLECSMTLGFARYLQ